MKIVFGQGGVVINVASTEEEIPPVMTWLVDDASTIKVGDVFDANDPKMDAAGKLTLRLIFEQENRIRQLTRALRATSTAANNAATAAGLPATADSPDITAAQFRTYCKARIA